MERKLSLREQPRDGYRKTPRLGRYAVAFTDQAREDVLGADCSCDQAAAPLLEPARVLVGLGRSTAQTAHQHRAGEPLVKKLLGLFCRLA